MKCVPSMNRTPYSFNALQFNDLRIDIISLSHCLLTPPPPPNSSLPSPHHFPFLSLSDLATLGLRECMSYEDEDIGGYTHLTSNNIKQVVEVSNSLATPTTTPYKSYKIGRYRRGTLEWVSGMKGIRYGIGRYPKVALNDEG